MHHAIVVLSRNQSVSHAILPNEHFSDIGSKVALHNGS